MRKILIIWVCFALVINAFAAVPVRALDISITPETEFSNTAPLIITAYQTALSAAVLAAVEIYNQSNEPVDLSEWSLGVTAKDGMLYAVDYTTSYAGQLLPGEHVTATIDNSATYQLQYVSVPTVATIELHCGDASKNYRAVTAPIKDASDAPYFRTYTTTSYSTATQPFATTPYRPFYDDGLYVPLVTANDLRVVEIYPYASDCVPGDASVLCGDYVKLKNTGSHAVALDAYAVRTSYYGADRTASNTIMLYGNVEPGGTVVINTTNEGSKLSLTNSGGYVWLEDAWGLALYPETMQQYVAASADEQGYSYALALNGMWQWTTTPRPSGENVITEPVVSVAACPEGKYRSPETGRCRTIEEAVNALTACEEGYERNPTTNRCRKVVVATASELTPCKEGQERNPATNRCRSIASAVAELLPCDEGYERNPETNRCRKVKTDSVPSADFPVAPITSAGADASGWYAFATLGAIAAGYAIWEWRVEISGIYRKLLGVLRRAK